MNEERRKGQRNDSNWLSESHSLPPNLKISHFSHGAALLALNDFQLPSEQQQNVEAPNAESAQFPIHIFSSLSWLFVQLYICRLALAS